MPGRSKAVFTQRLTVSSQPPPRRLFSCSTVNPTRHGRLTVTSAWNVWKADQSSGTRIVVSVGQRPPAEGAFRVGRAGGGVPRRALDPTGGLLRLGGGRFGFRPGFHLGGALKIKQAPAPPPRLPRRLVRRRAPRHAN